MVWMGRPFSMSLRWLLSESEDDRPEGVSDSMIWGGYSGEPKACGGWQCKELKGRESRWLAWKRLELSNRELRRSGADIVEL